jgi:hypothetical protein
LKKTTKNGYPIAFDESKDVHRFWGADPGDRLLPSTRGFISDYVYATRGIEAPTLFNIWTALFTLSSVLKREVWIPWGPLGRLFPNLYVLIVGPAGLVKKTTIVGWADSLINGFPKFITNESWRAVKSIKFLYNKSTPEAMLEVMKPDKRGGRFVMLTDEAGATLMRDGRPIKWEKTSEIALILPEFAVMASKASYNESLIQNLLDLYDTHESWKWTTVKRGQVELRKLYTNLLGGITVTGFQQAIPESALSDGFLSRTIVVYHEAVPSREFRYPQDVPGAPTKEDLQERLAWIANNMQGEFALDEEADAIYEKWYHDYRVELLSSNGHTGIIGRKFTHLLKVALLIRASRYKPKVSKQTLITAEDFRDAMRLINSTYKGSTRVLKNISLSAFQKKVNSVGEYIESKGSVKRIVLLQNQHISASDAAMVLDELLQEGKIEIRLDGKKQKYVSRSGDEEYHWIGTKEKDDE